jgi:CheY-like chemotaxis protein
MSVAASAVDLLVVEDDDRDLEMTLRALRKVTIAFGIAVARDGVEALEFLFGEGRWAARRIADPPRLVLLDLKLPRVDGLEVLQRLRADPRTRTIPVVALTSSREHHDVCASYDLGVNSYIVKPVSFDAFTTAVGQLGVYWMLLNQPPGGAA